MRKAIEFLANLAKQLQEQDNICTASPNYCIQENVLICGIDEDYGGTIGWFNAYSEGYYPAEGKKAKALDRYYARYDKEPEGWNRCGYEFKWEYTGISFLTKAAADEYVADQRHRHTYDLRVYVDSHYRNAEMREVRRLLAGPVQECIAALKIAKGTIQHYQYGGSNYSVQANAAMRIIDNALAALDTATEPHR